MDNTVIIDDRDSRVFYSVGDWHESGDKEEFGSTTHGTNGIPGAQAILTFTGTSVVVYGTVAKNTATNSTYNVDESMPGTYINLVSPNNMYQQIFYQSDRLENKQHILTITTGSGVYWLDYFKVTEASVWLDSEHNDSTAPGMTPISSTSTSAGLAISNTLSSVVTSPSIIGEEPTRSLVVPTKSPAATTQSLAVSTQSLATSTRLLGIPTQPPVTLARKRSLSKAIIPGVIVGTLLVLIVIIFLVWRARRRRNALDLVPTPMIISTELSRVPYALTRDDYVLHKSQISSCSSRPSEPGVPPRDVPPRASLGAPPTYFENTPLPA